MKQPDEKTLDVVIAWVDGADPILKQNSQPSNKAQTLELSTYLCRHKH